MTKRTRLKITIIAGIFLGCLATYATYKGMQSIGVTAIGGFMTILSSYIWGETKRPSLKEKSYEN
jgi:drug/metabolite transporter (DMT)-like permease